MARLNKYGDGLVPIAGPSGLLAWAETLGEALGRGMARGINDGLARGGLPPSLHGPKRRGRPPKAIFGTVPPERRCKEEGCVREARSKGLCSAHYQAERRKLLTKGPA
jgi:hypothetical protein